MVSVVLNCSMYYVVLYCTDLEDGEEEDEDCRRTAAVIGFVEENLKSRQEIPRVLGVLLVVVQPLVIRYTPVLVCIRLVQILQSSDRQDYRNP